MSRAINLTGSVTGFIAIAAVFSACSDNSSPAETNRNLSEYSVQSPAPGDVDQMGVLDLSTIQLGDADILNTSGIVLAEVERVITDSSGAMTKLLVQMEDTDPAQFVEIPIEGLTPKSEGDEWNLETKMSKDDLMALPKVDY